MAEPEKIIEPIEDKKALHRLNSKKWYIDNKQYHSEYMKQKIKCKICGQSISRNNTTNHRKTNKCKIQSTIKVTDSNDLQDKFIKLMEKVDILTNELNKKK